MELSIKVKAVQWFKDGDHPNVKPAGPKLLKRGDYFYVEGMWPFAEFWMEIAELAERPKDVTDSILSPNAVEIEMKDKSRKYYRRVLPFNIWKVRGEKIHEEIDTPENRTLFEDYQMCAAAYLLRPGEEPRTFVPYGVISPPASDGRVAVFPGCWIVEVGNKVFILSDEDFKKQYPNPASVMDEIRRGDHDPMPGEKS